MWIRHFYLQAGSGNPDRSLKLIWQFKQNLWYIWNMVDYKKGRMAYSRGTHGNAQGPVLRGDWWRCHGTHFPWWGFMKMPWTPYDRGLMESHTLKRFYRCLGPHAPRGLIKMPWAPYTKGAYEDSLSSILKEAWGDGLSSTFQGALVLKPIGFYEDGLGGWIPYFRELIEMQGG